MVNKKQRNVYADALWRSFWRGTMVGFAVAVIAIMTLAIVLNAVRP